ncbi:MAG: hypothetical protein EHM44_01075 [Ignavibacteriales bacterium]|nr:MAG: hypothetical protein EHM44_01075 [Ignavibacteriales bacterium]
MKFLIIWVALFFTVAQSLFPQSLKCKVGGDLNLHLKQKESSSQYSPHSYDVEYPSIASFFDDAAGFNLDVSYRFGNTITPKGQVFIGVKYERCGINSNSSDAKYILGESILKNKFIPYLGYGKYLDPSDYYTFVYGYGGFVIKSYSGEGSLPGTIDGTPTNFEAKYNYSNSLSFKLGGGIDFENIEDSPITVGLQASLEIGKINRGTMDIYYKGEKIGEGNPEGEKSLYDNTIYLSVSIGYQINWENFAE